MEEEFGLEKRVAIGLARAVGGHHGVFDSSGVLNDSRMTLIGDGQWNEARRDIVLLLSRLLGVDGKPVSRGMAGYALLAGLTTASDWIASAEEYFPYAGAPAELDLERYWWVAQDRAAAALQRAGWTRALEVPRELSFRKMFGIESPRRLQTVCADMAETSTHPCLMIVEAPMGEGKTEAALYFAERLRQRFGLRGSYIGLPTQATSNQMFGRVVKALTAEGTGGVAHLHLLHGHAALSAEFACLRKQGREFEITGLEEEAAGRQGAMAAAGEWFTHKKRGLLAPFGVGTVDQALMAALQSKHVFVRLLGLSGKVVILDEVHAYDTYMSSLLEALLRWLRSIGSSVVMLSATLPEEKKIKFLDCFGQGQGAVTDGYPSISLASTAGISETTFETSQAAKRVRLRRLQADANGLAKYLDDLTTNGGTAAVICNTVSRAQTIFRACRERIPESASDGNACVDVLHSRFPFERREEKEKGCLRRFGKEGEGTQRPRRAILIATQVIEQSLDLDFDFMVSELAPIDMLLQRIGRLHRHERDNRPGGSEPELLLLDTPMRDDGVPEFSAGDEHVYERHILLRTWLALRGRTELRIPEEIRPLVEEVYRDEPNENLSPALNAALQESRERLEAVRAAEREQAEQRRLPNPEEAFQLEKLTSMGRDDDEDLHPVFRALTRLVEESVQAICLYGRDGRLFLDSKGVNAAVISERPNLAATEALLRRSCTLTDKRVVFALREQEIPKGWMKSPLLRHCRAVGFGEERTFLVNGWRIVLDDEEGLRVEENRA